MSERTSGSGCGTSSILLFLLVASVALNVALLSGCSIVDSLRGNRDGGPGGNVTSPRIYDATDDLREIADRLGVETEGKGAYEIASGIKTKIYVDAEAKGFPRDVLSEERFEKVKKVLPEDAAKIVSDYHTFVMSLKGKRFVIVP